MRILIIGGTRFIGPYVVRSLHKQGHQITLFHRGETQADLPDEVQHIYGDRCNLGDFREPLKLFAPTVVVDLIPVTEGEALDVMNIFRSIAQRVVAISSQDVYRAYGVLIGIEPGPIESVPLTERSALRDKLYPYRDQSNPEHRLYDYDKILVERVYLSDPELLGTVLRFPMVYGPGDYQHRLYPYLKRMDDGRQIIILEEGMSKWCWSRGYVEDMAAAVVLAINNECSVGCIYNVAEAETLSEIEWVRAIGDAVQWDGELLKVQMGRLPEKMRSNINSDQQLVVDTNLIRGELGYRETVDRIEALRRTISWERKNPPESIDPELFDYAAEDALLARLE
ncbi:MAG: NAD-dependent epimerase/dehydratase family protein [Chloroflexota bacterium]|nr:NAD-dependent epimerase/dehydratase family protein [Chloroflexota bacterium]